MLYPYQRSAEVYDLYYGWLDYEGHARAIREWIDLKKPGAESLLELACGTGRFLEQFDEWYEVEGLDVAEPMLAVARERCPDVAVHRTDMREFDLGRRFDVVVCLFSSIAYITSRQDLQAVMASAGRHLDSGGVLIIEPWFAPDAWQNGHVGSRIAEGNGIAAARIDTSVREGDLVTMRWSWAVARTDGSADAWVEEHPTMLFPVDTYMAAFSAVGFEATYDPAGPLDRGLYVALKQ